MWVSVTGGVLSMGVGLKEWLQSWAVTRCARKRMVRPCFPRALNLVTQAQGNKHKLPLVTKNALFWVQWHESCPTNEPDKNKRKTMVIFLDSDSAFIDLLSQHHTLGGGRLGPVMGAAEPFTPWASPHGLHHRTPCCDFEVLPRCRILLLLWLFFALRAFCKFQHLQCWALASGSVESLWKGQGIVDGSQALKGSLPSDFFL